ncbi:alpha-ketoglutarate-dependent dioxygenase AlkB [Methylocystis sp. L43]|jgi:alkylated DNA repair protein (DNA oxidative demethylase)|uniref:alpha-ketoglutarate-dependent dioxygenase AlkB family protein n=1 Tax=unclassified Methylocystis TaxID=2625913 RepID=UPI0018C31A10|nr:MULTISPECIES: alpha-ketoglutarate-dependent dioxygenase AlkB [unclassified Methylocystis]MBG0798275.1 alpha-ketoglutarate-dependent dioxygenase AlkB [Methylocystis sp. L43]MBG0805640.1 alpha-ketoglutarate-dependent dioxygenase AlkB [Methylocystis sp. H15]
MPEIAPGAFHYPRFLDAAAQTTLAEEIAEVIAAAPLYVSTMPKTGAPMSVRMTNCGALGWVSDKERGYRYEPRHPGTENAWPAMPLRLLELWNELAHYHKPPEACLVNVYDETARMGLHQDKDESDFDAPILSLSLGADCRFRLGGTRRGDRAPALTLSSGDALVLSGPARMRYHGVDRILPTIGAPLPPALAALGVRVNLTLRRVT